MSDYAYQAEREMWDHIARTQRPTGRATRTITNRRPGPCSWCGATVAVGEGLAELHGRTWTVRHRPQEWAGSPISGGYVGGCPQ